MSDMLQQAHQTLSAIRGFEKLTIDDYKIERLGGLTNLVFRIDYGEARYVLRIPGKGTEEYIDRVVEIHNARVAAAAGVSADVVFADTDSGVMLCRYIDDSVSMTPDEFSRRAGSAARAGRALRQMHDWPERFEFRFELFAMIDDYLSILDQRKAELPHGYAEVVESAQPVRASTAVSLNSSTSQRASCSCPFPHA